MSDSVFWILEASINAGQLDNLKALISEMIDGTKDNEPGALNYEWFIADDGKSLHIYERYTDSGAVMIHRRNFGQKYAERFSAYLTVTKITMYGNPSDAVREGFAGFAPIYMSPSAGFTR
ncbi:MAG: antibiotic biosynthesis monooxygenase [Chloroflexota bacterium]